MSFKEMMADDLDVFYNADEFAVTATYKGVDISVIFLEDIEVSSSEQKVISAKTSDVAGLSSGDSIIVDGIDYEVSNFDDKDSSKLEQLIAINEV